MNSKLFFWRMVPELMVPAVVVLVLLVLGACAKQSSLIEGGPMDKNPPVIVGAAPSNFSTGFKENRIQIDFDEYVQMREMNKHFSVSPPMAKRPEVLLYGKYIRIRLESPLKEDVTYTLNFGKSIVDNNESNPLGFFEYVFSTGQHIDSLSITGRVLNAYDLKAGDEKDQSQTFVRVMLYSTLDDSIPYKEMPDYVGVADEAGFFRIPHVRPGTYKLFAVRDIGDNLLFDIPTEQIAFADSLVVMDHKFFNSVDSSYYLLYDDSIKIKTPELIPIDVEMFLFQEPKTRQYLTDAQRPDMHRLVFSFNLPIDRPLRLAPVFEEMEGIEASQVSPDWLLQQISAQGDTVQVWIKDTTLLKISPLLLSVTYPVTDSLLNMVEQTDTLRFTFQKPTAAPRPSGGRARVVQIAPSQPRMAHQILMVGMATRQPSVDLHVPFRLLLTQPVEHYDPSRLQMFEMVDTLMQQVDISLVRDTTHFGRFAVQWDMKENTKYVLSIDTLAFTSIYGASNDSVGISFQTQSSDFYSTVRIALSNVRGPTLVQALNPEGTQLLKQVAIDRSGVVNLNFLPPSTFMLKVVHDTNQNGQWDTGHYLSKIQPERVEFYPELIITQSSFTSDVTWRLR